MQRGRLVDLDNMKCPARRIGSWCSRQVSTRAHQESELVTAAGHNQADLYGDKDHDAEELETGQP
jgi:hypothetical protein